jgi:transposase
MGKTASSVNLTDYDRKLLESWVRAKTTPQRVVFRAQICLLAADELSIAEIAQKLNTSRPTVVLWKKRFEEQGPEGLLKDASRGPSPRKLDPGLTKTIIDTTLSSQPSEGDHWTTRSLAKVLGVSNATIARVWKSKGIKPKSKKTTKVQKKTDQTGNVAELVSLFVNPPIKALIFACRRSNGNNGNGSLNLVPDTIYSDSADTCDTCFSAALNLLDSVQIPLDLTNSMLSEFKKFLEETSRSFHGNGSLHLILDGHDTLKWNGTEITRIGGLHVHIRPMDILTHDFLSRLVSSTLDSTLSERSAHLFRELVEKITSHVLINSGKPDPFIWIYNETKERHGNRFCQNMAVGLQQLGSFLKMQTSQTDKLWEAYSDKEVTLNWKDKLMTWFAASAFAEEGEQETAMRMVGITPDKKKAQTMPFLSTVFTAAAFAEADCHDTAMELMGYKTRKGFLEIIGLQGVKVRYGVASANESFFEVAGLVGVKHRMLTITM